MNIFLLVSNSSGAKHTRISTKVGQDAGRKGSHVIKMREKKFLYAELGAVFRYMLGLFWVSWGALEMAESWAWVWTEPFLRPKEPLKKACGILLCVCKHEGGFVMSLRSGTDRVKSGLYLDKWYLKSPAFALARDAVGCFLSSTSKIQQKREILKV